MLITDVNNNGRRGGHTHYGERSILGLCLLIKNNFMIPVGEAVLHTGAVSRPWCFYLETTAQKT